MAREERELTAAEAEAEERRNAPKVTGPVEAQNRVFCFVSKREIPEADAVELPYLNGEMVKVGKTYIKYKLAAS
jgi:hypothetical protein